MNTKPTLAFIIVNTNGDVPEAKTSMCHLVGINSVAVKLDENITQSELHSASKNCHIIYKFITLYTS